MSSVLSGIEDIASKEGYNLIISQSLEQKALEKNNANTMYNKRVDGLLISIADDTTEITHLNPFLKNKYRLYFLTVLSPGLTVHQL